MWKGLVEHSIDGWNIGPAPTGTWPSGSRTPTRIKASQGRTKTRLVLDPATRARRGTRSSPGAPWTSWACPPSPPG